MNRLSAMILFLAALFLCYTPMISAQDGLTSKEQNQVKQIVKDYMLSNPELLKDMVHKLRQQEQQQQQAQASKAIANHSQAIFHNSDDPVLGNAQGSVTLVEFMDYQCPHCQEMASIVDKLINNNANLKVVIKELPIYDKTSYYAAMAALAAKAQGKFKAFHHALLGVDDDLTKEKIHQIAGQVGLDVSKLKQQMTRGAYQQTIKTNYQLAKELGLRGTPIFIIGTSGNNAEFIGHASNYKKLQQTIDAVQ